MLLCLGSGESVAVVVLLSDIRHLRVATPATSSEEIRPSERDTLNEDYANLIHCSPDPRRVSHALYMAPASASASAAPVYCTRAPHGYYPRSTTSTINSGRSFRRGESFQTMQTTKRLVVEPHNHNHNHTTADQRSTYRLLNYFVNNKCSKYRYIWNLPHV